ncbi:MAG TPA: D-aminoacyl-tRNA deacylase [Spongiibacteraceae bacterium]|jgi:D-tyrosyl-tRNA(Tyr) deacylase|nr:D-aminoacyl-tRNA deacylase [Spongiibacteraceae bacterium]HUH38050.1 D-aminoacyl-tRNA deacylase [Spongiibacteraceae bacterium]
MKALIQRVNHASVVVDGEQVGAIARGLLVLLGVERDDSAEHVARLAQRLLDYRVFADDAGRMNRCLRDTGGGLLLVSQFTLAADTRKGLRPSFSSAAEPALARELYELMLATLRESHAGPVAAGRFGADMQVALVNDGPVTFLLTV